MQHDRLRVVEAGEDVDPPRRPEDPGLAGQRLRSEVVSVAVRPSPWSSSSVASASAPEGNSEPAATTRVRRPEQHLGERDDVDAEVEQRAAAQREVEQPVGRVVLAGTPRSACTERTSPIAPSATSSRTATTAGWKRVHIASMTKTPVARARSTTSGGAGGGGGERLLHQQRLAGAQRGQREGVVLGCGVAT